MERAREAITAEIVSAMQFAAEFPDAPRAQVSAG